MDSEGQADRQTDRQTDTISDDIRGFFSSRIIFFFTITYQGLPEDDLFIGIRCIIAACFHGKSLHYNYPTMLYIIITVQILTLWTVTYLTGKLIDVIKLLSD